MRRLESVIVTILGVILYHGTLVLGIDYCEDYGQTRTYCDSGYHCCNNNTQCCADGLSVGVVVGIVFGIIFLVCMCVFCAIVVTKKKKLRPNQLIRPLNQQNVTISTVGRSHQNYPVVGTNPQGQNYLYSQPYYPYGQPVPYGQHPAQAPIQPPPYSQTAAPAYPPPPEYKLEP